MQGLLYRGVLICTSLACALAPARTAPAGEPAKSSGGAQGAAGEIILDTYSFWRCHLTLRPMLFGIAAEAKAAPEATPSLHVQIANADGTAESKRMRALSPGQPSSPFPPGDWVGAEFDDHEWWREPGPFFDGHGGDQLWSLALLCLRGRFTVSDPAKVKRLTFSAAFRGGMVVHLNGREAARCHMPEGSLRPEAVAEDYPAAAFFDEREVGRLPKEEKRKRYEMRVRRAAGLDLPVALLRKGTNVLAIEIHRAALGIKPAPPRGPRYSRGFNTCGLLQIELRASGGGAVPNRSRPRGFRVWNADLLDLVTVVDFGEADEKLHPIRIAAARGGAFSGQVVAGSDGPIKGLRAEATGLRHREGKGTIPPSAVRVRYPRLEGLRIANCYLHPRFPWKDEWNHRHWGSTLPNFDTLDDEPPAEVRVQNQAGAVRPGHPYVAGAVQPIWVTVDVPPDAAVGDYEGGLTVRAQGAEPVEVPVALRVTAWRVPEGKSFRTLMDFVQSPESLAAHYRVPLWSEKHFALIERTFEILASVGNDAVYIPIIAETHFGNAQSMVRWVRKADGKYDFDFGLAERYLDLAEKHLGRPRIVCFHVWDYHIGGDVKFGRSMVGRQKKDGTNPWVPKVQNEIAVSRLEAATARVERLGAPSYLQPGAAEVWKPLGAALSAFVRKRGLGDAAVLGVAGDILPSKEIVLFWKEIYPESRWMIHGHGGWPGAGLYGVPIGYVSFVAGGVTFALVDPAVHRFRGWKVPALRTLFARGLAMRGQVPPPAASWLMSEWNIAGEQQGLGRVTADFFRVPGKDGRGSSWLPDRFRSTCSWRNAGLRPPLLAPGPEGAVPTARFELLRQGLQECEARISIEEALTDGKLRAKLGEELAARCQAVLDERTRYIMWVFDYKSMVDYNHGGSLTPGGPVDINWYAGSGWQDRAEKLFSAAAEVARALGKE